MLAHQGHRVTQIAGMLLGREDTVARVLKRFVAGGLDAIARRTSSGRQRSVAAAWEAELVWMIEVDPLS